MKRPPRYCELCGRPAQELFRVVIEGAVLRVCSRCKISGKPLPERRVAPRRRPVPLREPPELSWEIDPEYPRLVREARERAGLTREELARLIGEKESVVRRIERGELKPSLALARKLEHALKVEIIRPSLEREEVEPLASPELPSFGEVVVVRRKRR